MELYRQILIKALEQGRVEVKFPQSDLTALVEMKSYQMLKRIHEIVSEAGTSDEDCFNAIEEVVCTFENEGIFCGDRHDF